MKRVFALAALVSSLASFVLFVSSVQTLGALFIGASVAFVIASFVTPRPPTHPLESTRKKKRSSSKRLRIALDALPLGVVILEDESVNFVNDTFYELMQVPKIEVRLLPELLRHPEALEHVRLAKGTFVFEQGARTLRLYVHRSAQVTALALEDITRAAHLEVVRTDFVANVSHALRTPLAIVRSNLEALEDEEVIADVQSARLFLKRIDRQSLRLAALVEDILLLSRIESERLAKAPEHIMVKQDIASWVADERVELDIDENLVLESDRKALGYIVSNLVENALKYAPDSKVIVRATTRNDKFLLEVFDEGPGIDHAFRKRIFERFYRPPESTREGTGLGLSIVKNLTQSLGGQCGVKDNTPKGSVFWVEL